jgi:uncharacterized membrane protein YoaK (UPF0700 family)
MDKTVTWLRIAYWTAGIADFIVAALALIPTRMGVNHYVYPMGLMAAVAFSWGVLLLYADRQPLERRWILFPTILVVALLGIVAVHAGLTGLIPFARVIPTAIVTIIVLSILIYSLDNARNLD